MTDPRKDYLKAQPVVQEIMAEAVREENRRCQDVERRLETLETRMVTVLAALIGLGVDIR